MRDEKKIQERLKDDYARVTNMGYKCLGIFLQGSQNYNLDYAGSDIDTKAIIIPTIVDVILNKSPISTTYVREDNSHIDLKDIRLMWQCFKKQNINFLEILFTKYYYLNEYYSGFWYNMQDYAEEIAHYNNYAAVNCIVGMILEKTERLCHPYPSCIDKIEKYGYDNKELCHILRCREFLDRYIAGEKYADCLVPTNPRHLIDVKAKFIYSVDEAKEMSSRMVNEAKEIRDNYMKNNECVVNKDIENLMQDILVSVIKRSFREDLLND